MATDVESLLTTEYLGWLRGLSSAHRFGPDDRKGTANLIDDAARARAAAAVRTGAAVGLSRPLVPAASGRGDAKPGFALEVFYTDGPIGMGSDHLELDCHGVSNTHIDALNHIAVEGTWYGLRPVDEPGSASLGDVAADGLVTRGVHVDVPRFRGTDWVDPDVPVTGADLDGALALAGTPFHSGDALLLDMGRDRYEAAGHTMADSPRPGIGADGARWINAHDVSIVCWDFLDSTHPSEPLAAVHMLNWAIGLLLVDNCDFVALRAALPADRSDGALVIAALPIPGATGCNVNPLVLV